MIDHFGIPIRNFEAAMTFYQKVLETLGSGKVYIVPEEFTNGEKVAGFGDEVRYGFWINQDTAPTTPLHFAFAAQTRKQVDAFHAAGLLAGGTDNGKPGLRPHYHANYYAAFIVDLDGNNIEAVCHTAA